MRKSRLDQTQLSCSYGSLRLLFSRLPTTPAFLCVCLDEKNIPAVPPLTPSFPRAPHTASLSALSPRSRKEVRSPPTLSPPQLSGGEGVLHTQAAGTIRPFHCPLALAGQGPAFHTGAAASGTGDSTSLPTGFSLSVKAQVCEGSAWMLLDAEEEEVAEAWAARSR